jgi:putative sigma-54 modulation protein
MKPSVRHSNIPVSAALADHIDRKIGRAVRRFQERIHSVTVRLVDENGPRGGVDTRCRAIVELFGGRQIIVHGRDADAYGAVARAAARLQQQVTRAVSRSKTKPAAELR